MNYFDVGFLVSGFKEIFIISIMMKYFRFDVVVYFRYDMRNKGCFWKDFIFVSVR